MEPYVIVTDTYTHNNGSTAYKVTGLSVEILKAVCEKMNLTVNILAPQRPWTFEFFSELLEGLTDVACGLIPLIPLVVTSSFDVTIPHLFGNVKMLVPCPKAIHGIEKVLTTFSLSVWLTIGLVLLLTTAVFWCAGNGSYRSVCNETHTYRSLSNCFHNAWAVFVGVSVPQQPTSSNLRVFFFLYVCFCFVISTVFQAFFVSYLVEPTYENKLETLVGLLNSDVIYGHNAFVNLVQETVGYPEAVTYFKQKTLKEDCSDYRKCVERMITKRDIATLSSPFFATYVAREMGIVDVGKIVCSLDETLFSIGVTALFKKGNPLLDRFNILMRRYLEAGLLELHWTKLQHRASLTGGRIFRETVSDVFFAFSVSHLMPAFLVLLVGTLLSSVAIIGELIVNWLCKCRIKNSQVWKVRLLY